MLNCIEDVEGEEEEEEEEGEGEEREQFMMRGNERKGLREREGLEKSENERWCRVENEAIAVAIF